MAQHQHTELQLLIGGFLILLVLGGGGLFLFYGTGTALAGIAVILAGLLIFFLLWLLLTALGRWANPDGR